MAIVPMKRLSVVAPADRKEGLLSRLQDLGALHLCSLAEAPEVSQEHSARLASVKRCEAALKLRGKRRKDAMASVAPSFDASLLPDGGVVGKAEGLLGRKVEIEARLAALGKERDLAAPWGGTCAADVDALRSVGLAFRAFWADEGRLRDIELPGCPWKAEIPGRRGKVILALATFGEPPDLPLERIDPPARPAPAIEGDIRAATASLLQVGADLDAVALRRDAIQRERERLTDLVRLAEARAKAGGDGDVFAVQGWCPAGRAEEVVAATTAIGGAALLDDPGPEDQPPVQVQNNAVIGWFEPLLGAFQYPNYREPDPTALFAPFMAIFFGFCLGDAAYGALLLAFATFARRRFRLTQGTWNQALRLMQLLGTSTIAVGLLTGIVFGVQIYKVPFLVGLGLREDMLLFSLSDKPENFFYAALVFGAVQLAFGILVRLALQLRRRQWQPALGTVGWLLLLPGAPLWATTGSKSVFLVALALITFFKNPSSSLLGRLGGGVWGWYEWVLGLFGDVMSYLRIFGLGLSSGIIAQVINTIALMMIHSGSVLGWLGGFVILLVGHTFNFAMSVLGSTVHSARLQFLEFFGKFFEGGGQPYSPFGRSR